MCYMCAERNKSRHVFSTAIDLMKAKSRWKGGDMGKFQRNNACKHYDNLNLSLFNNYLTQDTFKKSMID